MCKNAGIMTEELPVEELEALAEDNVGEAVRRTRLHYGKTLEDVEQALRIRACQIEAIERGDMAELPGRVYAIGFVRSYAEYLELDSDKVVQLFKKQYMDGPINTALSFPVPASETKTPSFRLIALSLLLFCLFFAGIYIFHTPDDTPALEIRDIPEDIKNHVVEDILPQPPPASAPALYGPPNTVGVENMKEDEAQKTGIILNITGDSWVEIKNNDGKILVSKILKQGDEYFVPDRPGLSMSLGNAGHVEIILNGRPLKPLGKDGAVRRDIPLDSAYLGTLAFKDAP